MVPALNGVRLLLIGNGIVKDERAVMAMSRSGDPAELLRWVGLPGACSAAVSRCHC